VRPGKRIIQDGPKKDSEKRGCLSVAKIGGVSIADRPYQRQCAKKIPGEKGERRELQEGSWGRRRNRKYCSTP